MSNDNRDAHADTTPVAPGATAPAPGPAAFAAGTLIAGRYRIVKLLGVGGMGEVYEAEDLLLRERVALKTIRREVARDEGTAARFKREIQLARKVTHANVCRIFDVGLHDDAPFITMEVLDGETLAARLKRSRPPLDEAERIARQIVAALAAAHEVGVIHRDFKSPNVMLVERAGGGLRAVVTDFGLARALEEDAALAITGDGGVVGSPAYMAPEQVEGKIKLTAAADIYALGVVLFELATGRLPFVGETPLATMTLRLREPPPAPRSIVEDLPERWEQTILRCLEREPGKRFARVEEVAAGLAAPARPQRSRWRWAWPLVGLVVAAAALVLTQRRHAPEAAPVAPSGGRTSVAIVGFKNLSGRADADYLGSLLPEFMATGLAAGERLRIIDGESVVRARRELALPETDSFAQDTLAKLRAQLGSDFIVVGAYALIGDDVHVDLRLQDTRTGATVASISDDGKKDEILKLVGRLAEKLRAKMGAGDLSESQRAELAAALPQKPAVQKLYAEGLAQLRIEACSAARAPLEQAVAAEPGFAPAHTALSEALECLGYDDRAEEEAKKAVELSAALPADAQLAARVRLEELSGEHDKALADYEALFAKRPDDASTALHLMRQQARAGKLDAARATLAALRKLPGGDTAATDLTEVNLDGMTGALNLNDRLAALEKVRARAERDGARLVIGGIALEEAGIASALNQLDRARAAAADAKAIFQTAADHDGELQAMSIEVSVLSRLGDAEGVRRAHEAAQTVAQGLEGARSFFGFEISLAKALAEQGDLAGARRVYDEVGAWCRARGRKRELAGVAISLAGVQLDQGDLAGAGRSLDETQDYKGDNVMWGVTRGRLLLLQGDSAGAHVEFAKFVAALPVTGVDREAAQIHFDGAVLDADGKLAEAEKAYRRGRELIVARAGKVGAVQALPWLVNVLIEEGKLAEARTLLDLSPEERAAANSETRIQLDSLTALVSGLMSPAQVAAAEKKLAELDTGARRAGYVVRAYGVELALARLQLHAGHTAAGRATVAAIVKEARAAGAERIARKAENLLTPRP
jgi:tRNA A-37 threonylcarbamoyl transferase component Bud32/TolB-like protein